MSKNKITDSFRLFSVLSVLGATVIARLLQIGYLWAASDVTVSRVFVYLFLVGYELFGLLAVILALCSTVYAHSYFGKRTAAASFLSSLGCLSVGKVIAFVYQNLINYEFAPSRAIAGLITYSMEIAFDAVFILIALLTSVLFAKSRQKRESDAAVQSRSPLRAALTSSFIYIGINFLIIPATDLTVQHVIPFFVRYDDISATEVRSIIMDYLYTLRFLPVYIIGAFALTVLGYILLTRVTGKLQVKNNSLSKTKG